MPAAQTGVGVGEAVEIELVVGELVDREVVFVAVFVDDFPWCLWGWFFLPSSPGAAATWAAKRARRARMKVGERMLGE